MINTDPLSWGNYIFFALASVIVIYVSIVLSYVVDAIGKRTKFSGALVAGTVVAFISSLPEFTMSLTNIITGKGGDGYPIAAGNLMGGNIFRTMILAVCLLIFIYTIKKAKTKSNQIFLIGMQTIVCICFFITVFFSDQMSSISPLLFLIPDIFAILAYIANIIFMIKTDKNSEQGKQLVLRRHVKQMFILESLFLIRVWLMKTKIKNVFITFGFVSLSIVLCSFTLGLNMDYIIGTINSLGDKGNKAFLASLLGGIVTSIPEIVTVLTLLKIGDSEAAITDILGSNIFSCFILGFNDLVTWAKDGNIWSGESSSELCSLGFWFIMELFFIFSILIVNKIFWKRAHKTLYHGIIGFCLLMCVMSYMFYILQSTNVIPAF